MVSLWRLDVIALQRYRAEIMALAKRATVASYRLEVKRSAAKEVADLPKADCQRIVAKLQALADDPRPHGAEKYRVRQGNYRILYEIDDASKTVTIVKVGNRKEVHR